MTVQIYQNEELNDIMFQVEALDEWKQLAGELGMKNQLSFVELAESPIPYPFVNRSMELVFSTLCPSKVGYKEYSKTPIPLEVLKQIALSVRDNHFTEIQIWFDDKTPDPFAIGVKKTYYAYNRQYNRLKDSDGKDMIFQTKNEAEEYAKVIGFDLYGTNELENNKYLIARWADEIRPLNELKELAKGRLIEQYGAELRNTLENATQALKKINDNVLLYLSGDITESQLKGESRF